MSRFEPSEHSYGADVAAATTPAPTSFLDKITSTVTGLATNQSAQMTAWTAVVNAIADPRQRVATLRAKIANYKKMRDEFPEPIKTLYSNQIVLMQSRLKAEQVNLGLEKEGESSTSTWRTIGHTAGYVAIGLGVLVGGYVVVRTVKAAWA